MNHRDRFIRTVQFLPVDQLPMRHAYGLMPGVLAQWRREGLPTHVASREAVTQHFGFPPKPHSLPLHVGPDPGFQPRVLEEDEEMVVAMDTWGRKTKLIKRNTTLPLALEFPVRDWKSWSDYKWRFQFSPGRVGMDLESVAARNVADGRVNGYGSRGFYWFPRDLMGDENLAIAYYERPDLVHDMNETWCRLIEEVLRTALRRVSLDVVHLNEDMAYRNASMVGKHIFDEFMAPYYRRIHRIVEEHRVPVFSVDTDGCVNELVYWFRDCGVNLIGPNEVQAGNDITSYRRTLGCTMAYDGGLDKRVLPNGQEAVEEMLRATVPFMKETGGGWIICLDHRVVPGTSLATFEYYVRRARELATF
jgi:uroporphyrinogen decarboxylase